MLLQQRLDFIYDLFDSLIREGKFEELNYLISLLDMKCIDVDSGLTVLVASLPAKTKLPARTNFFNGVAVRHDFLGLLEGLM